MRTPRTWLAHVTAATAAALCAVTVTMQPTAADTEPGPSPEPATSAASGDVLSGTVNGDLVGTPSRPDRNVKAAKRAQAEAAAEAAVEEPAAAGIAGFTTSSGTLHPIPTGLRPYEGGAITSPTGFGTVDADGVRMFVFPGVDTAWNHPVAQAQYALANLNSYRLTGANEYLEIATRNARRLVDRAVTAGDAWFFPYDFDFAIHGDMTQELKAPWYSAMAQGQALSTFTRLWQVTGDPKWRDAMDRTFVSLTIVPSADAPFVTWVDSGQRLWLEEYPRYPADHGERVLNGHIFAIFGLYDYWSATGAPADAAQLIRGALSTVERTALSSFRQPLRASLYSLNHRIPHKLYHAIHINQFLLLWRMTRDPAWLRRAQAFESDFPSLRTRGTAVLRRGVTHRLYRVSSSAKITSTRTVTLQRRHRAPFSSHFRTADGGPVVMRISAGRFEGWSVAEVPGRSWALGAIDVHDYTPRPTVVLPAGRHVALRLGSRGGVVDQRELTLPRSSSFVTSASATVRGSRAFYARNGALAGYWVLIGPGTRFAGDGS